MQVGKIWRSFGISASISLIAVVSFNTQAQPSELEEIIVTAEKRGRKLQDLPSSITVVQSGDLELSGGHSLVDAATLVPNVIVQNQGGRTSTYFYTRGIGRSELNFPIVSVNVNGVALPDPSFFGLDLDAAEQIEFLRGPQGTLFGQNTLGGAINIQLKNPKDLWAGTIDLSVGERSFREVALRLSGPVVGDKLRVAVTFLANDVDGYIDNPTRNESQNPEKTLGGSLYVIAEPNENLTIELNYFGQNREDGLPQYANGSDLFTITNDAPTEEDVRSDVLGLKLSHSFGLFVVESQTGWAEINRFTQNDTDFSEFPLVASSADGSVQQWSQELRVLSVGEGGFNYVAGLYGSGLSTDYDVIIDDFIGFFGFGLPVRVNDIVKFNDKTLAAFTQLNWQVGRWELVAGLRYQMQKIKTDNTNSIYALPTDKLIPLAPASKISATETFKSWLPKLAATYSLTQDIKAYTSVAKGFRAGGFNNTALTASRLGVILPISFDPEFTWNYEVGTKWQLPNGLGRLDLALFYIDWSDLQTEQFAPDTLLDFRTNAASATSVGAEVELRLYPHPDWEFGATLGYADAEYNDYVLALNNENLKGNQVGGGAKLTWSAFARYSREEVFGPLGLSGNISVNGLRGRFFDAENNVPGDDYSLLNARLGIHGQHWQAYIFARNLLNETYIDFEFPLFGAAVGEPRLIGVGIEANW